MKGFTRRLCVVALGAAIAIIAVAAPGAFAGAGGPRAATSRCTATSGVTVIVDFTHFGGRIERGCAPGHPADALIALHEAGFDTAGTTQYGDAFVCRIDALPTPKQDACTVTPPASAFWAFWNARPSDAGWTFTPVGVLDYQPAAGSIEAFAFGSRVQPSIPPSAAVPSTTTTRQRHAPTTAPTTAQRSTAPPSTPATAGVGRDDRAGPSELDGCTDDDRHADDEAIPDTSQETIPDADVRARRRADDDPTAAHRRTLGGRTGYAYECRVAAAGHSHGRDRRAARRRRLRAHAPPAPKRMIPSSMIPVGMIVARMPR